MRERPLWAIATDSLANQLLALGPGAGRRAGRDRARRRRWPPRSAPPLPAPRYVDVAGARFTRRASCCLIVRLPRGPLCTSCPRRPPAERHARCWSEAARWF